MRKRARILIVDDVGINRTVLKKILEDEYECFEAEDGEAAIKMLEDHKYTFHLILLDLMMPVVDGFGVLEYMNEKALMEKIPVMVISADQSQDMLMKAYSYGIVDMFQKPFSTEIVRKRIDTVLKLYRYKDTDALTGGLNRNAFIREAQILLQKAKDVSEFTILFFNIKNFKAMNELFGVESGDMILREFYAQLHNSDMHPILVTRLEADHFACLVCKGLLDLDSLSGEMERVVRIKNKKMRLFARFGVYNIVDNSVSVAQMIDRAKLAKQHIVDESAQPYAIYDEVMNSQYVDNAEVLSEFEDGMANGEFQVYYQPVIESNSGKLISAEALVRWIHPEKGFISPGAFIPALEQNGFITRLDRFMLDSVKKRIDERMAENLPVVPVSINLSWMDFYDDSMLHAIINLLSGHEMAKEKIRIEVTETSYSALEQNRENLIDNLRFFGAVILLDDFGSGYSSYAMLEKYNFDVLKIDMSFIKKIEGNEKNRKIVKSIINLCHDIGVKVVAEGAETEEQVQFLKDNKCDYIQGYYYSKPLSEKEFEAFVQKYYDNNMIKE